MTDGISLNIPEKLLPFWTHHADHKVAHGGRGGAKSQSFAQMFVARGVAERRRILCTREVQKSLRDSVYKLLADTIEQMGLTRFYDIQRDTIKGANGTEFLFSGLREHTVDSVKSYSNIDDCWVEEAHSVSRRSAEILVPTILRKQGAEMWWSFNPDQEDDYVYDRFIKHDDPNAIVIQLNWRDNPWFPPALERERLLLKSINKDLYDHVWEGKCRSITGLIFKRNWFKRYPLGKHPDNLNKYLSSDYAAGPDPNNPDSDPDFTEHGVWGLDANGELWAVDWWSGQTDPAKWIDAWLALIRRHKSQLRMAFEEKGVILRSQEGAINRAMRESDTYVAREGLASAGNKVERAYGFAARAAAGTVWIPECDWGDRLVNQLCAFNGRDGRTDDMVDVCSLVARGLDMMRNAVKPAQRERKEIKPFTREWLEASDRRNAVTEQQRKVYYE